MTRNIFVFPVAREIFFKEPYWLDLLHWLITVDKYARESLGNGNTGESLA